MIKILKKDDKYYISEEDINEAVKKITVVRDGKKKKVKKSTKKGYKIVDGKEVKQSSTEKRKLSKSAKKAAKKRKGKQSVAKRKRAKSIARRGSLKTISKK